MPAEDIGGAAKRPDDKVELRLALTAVAWHALLSRGSTISPADLAADAMRAAAALLKQLTKEGWL